MNTVSLKRLLPMFVALAVAFLGGAAFAKEPPVLMLMQVKGTVEYSKNGTKWKKVRRNKFLFAGYQLRTQADGSGTLINQVNGMSRQLGGNTVIKVAKEGAELVSGQLSDPAKANGSLLASLNKRFDKAQRYTTVRRSANKKKAVKLATVRKITLSEQFPELVWENVGPQYSYQIIIDDGAPINISNVTGDIVRHKLQGLSAGEHKYRVQVLEQGKVVYKPKKDNTIQWLSDGETTSLDTSSQSVAAAAPGDDFLMAAHMEEQGLSVAAMDLYRKYFKENPDDNDMRPLLIKAYHDLKLKSLKKKEAIRYNAMLDSE